MENSFLFRALLSLLTLCADLPKSSSLLPEPVVGSYYGFQYSTKVAKRLLFPGSATGTCKAGTVYQITSIEDLKNLDTELQCIFSSALTPSKIPEGPQPGGVLLALNARHLLINPIVSLLWKGNLAFKAKCNETEEVYVGYHNSFNRAVLPVILNVTTLKGHFGPGECEDGKPSAIMDFTQDFRKLCPDYATFVDENKDRIPILTKNLVNVYPQTQAIDAFRLVGRQADGSGIYLGKTYFKDGFREDGEIVTIAFWYMLNGDKEVNPEFETGQALPPLDHSFRYTFPGLVDLILKFLPVDNLLSRPIHTSLRLASGARKNAISYWLSFQEYLRNIGQRRQNRRRLRKYFESAPRAQRSRIRKTTDSSTTGETTVKSQVDEGAGESESESTTYGSFPVILDLE